jgi:hypothetical protein
MRGSGRPWLRGIQGQRLTLRSAPLRLPREEEGRIVSGKRDHRSTAKFSNDETMNSEKTITTSTGIMAQFNNLKNLENQMLLPGIKVNTSPTNHHPLTQMQLMRWDGKLWQRFGNIISGSNI